MERLQRHTYPATVHNHLHWHRETKPDGRRSVYRHNHAHSHQSAYVLDAGQDYALHSRQPHDHPHDRAALDALTVGYVARAA